MVNLVECSLRTRLITNNNKTKLMQELLPRFQMISSDNYSVCTSQQRVLISLQSTLLGKVPSKLKTCSSIRFHAELKMLLLLLQTENFILGDSILKANLVSEILKTDRTQLWLTHLWLGLPHPQQALETKFKQAILQSQDPRLRSTFSIC